MKPGDLVRSLRAQVNDERTYQTGALGTFVGFAGSGNYEYAEVIWFNHPAPNGDVVSSIQKDLIEVVKAVA